MASKNPFLSLPRERIQKIYNIASRALNTAKKLLSDPDKLGGYFCLLDIKTGAILATFLIGSVDPTKAERYKRLAEEKALRLYHFYLICPMLMHVSSRQSANESEDKWPGAVLGDCFIYSFSGFPPDYDEAISLATAFTNNDMPAERAEKIIFLTSPRIDIMTHPARAIIKALK